MDKIKRLFRRGRFRKKRALQANTKGSEDAYGLYEDIDEENEDSFTGSESDTYQVESVYMNNKEETKKSVEEEIKNRHVKEKNEDEKKYREDLEENNREDTEGRRKEQEQTEKVGLSFTQSFSPPVLKVDIIVGSEEENEHGEDVNENNKEETENSAEEKKKQDELNENEKEGVYNYCTEELKQVQEPGVSVREKKREENVNEYYHENAISYEEEEENQYDPGPGYLYNHNQILQVPAGQEYRESRRFQRLPAFENNEFWKRMTDLGLYVSYPPRTFDQSISHGEIILGVSENIADMPTLLRDQKRISPVLLCNPHGAALRRLITLRFPLNSSTPDPGSVIKVLHSDTDVNEPTDWQEANDADCVVENGQIILSISHFCLYCVIEEKVQATQKPRPMFIFLYLSFKKQVGEMSIEVTLRFSSSPTDRASPPRGGLFLKQFDFSVINNRLITISIQPNHPGWISLNQVSQQILDSADIVAMDTFQLTRNFHLVCQDMSSHGQTLVNTLHFNICMNQQQGRKAETQIYEYLDNLFPERFPRDQVHGAGVTQRAEAPSTTHPIVQVESVTSTSDTSWSSRDGPKGGNWNQNPEVDLDLSEWKEFPNQCPSDAFRPHVTVQGNRKFSKKVSKEWKADVRDKKA